MSASTVKEIIEDFFKEYRKKFGITPEINYGKCGRLVKDRLKHHSQEAIVLLIKTYFKEEPLGIYHLPTILSSYTFNRYLPRLRLDPNVFQNAEEHNKKIY